MIITIEMGSKDPEKQKEAPLCVLTLNRSEWEIQGGPPKMTTQLMWFLTQIQALRSEYKRRCSNKLKNEKAESDE